MQYRLGVFIVLSFAMVLLVEPAWSIDVPNIGGSATNVESKVKAVGGNVANVIAAVIGVMAVLGIMVGGGFAVARKFEEAKTCVLGSVVGLVIAGVAVGIGRLAA